MYVLIFMLYCAFMIFMLIDSSDSESSEYESGEEPVPGNVDPAQPANAITTSLVRWFVIFICVWQTLFMVKSSSLQ